MKTNKIHTRTSHDGSCKLPKKKPKRIRALRGWVLPGEFLLGKDWARYIICKNKTTGNQVALIDVSDREALIDQVAEVLRVRCADGLKDMDCVRGKCREDARAVLENLNLIAKRRARK